MKKMFRKAMTVLGSAALVGATLGVAAAATYPEPFTGNTAIVVGANAAPGDSVAAASIASDLDSASAGSSVTTTVTGGEVWPLGKESDPFIMGYNLGSVYASLDDNDMEDFLADGEYDDGSIDEEFTQIITLGTGTTLDLFADVDYDEDKTPTLGFHFDDDLILSYTMSFDTALTDYSDLEGTDMPLMGREYYVLDAASGQLELLDSAESTIITEGSSVTIGGKTVSIEYIEDTGAKFIVDGETTDKLYEDAADGDKYFELDDGSYLVFVENLYSSKDTGVSKAEVAIGKGKIILDLDGDEVEINDDTVDGLMSTVTTDGSTAATGAATDDVQDITISWYADNEEFLVEGGSMTMPGFETIKVLFGDFMFPAEAEEITVDNGETVTVTMENFDVEVLYATAEATVTMGSEDHFLHLNSTAHDTITMYVGDSERFIATYLDTDLSDIEQLYYEATSMSVSGVSDDEFSMKLKDLTDGNKDIDFENEAAGEDDTSRGDITVTLDFMFEDGAEVNATGTDTATFITEATAALINASTSAAFAGGNATDGDKLLVDVAKITVTHDDGDDLHFDTVVSEMGLVIEFVETSDLAGSDDLINLYEQNEDGDLDEDKSGTTSEFSVDIQWDSTDSEAYGVDGESLNTYETTSDDVYIGYNSPSILASKIEYDTDANSFMVEYYGEPVYADVSVASSDAVVTSSSESGIMTVKDSEVASVSGKNLIVVGGSAINSVAAELLGGAYRGDVFTSMTGVTDGEFLIQSFDRTGETALLVAGYNAADTTKAATYLINNDVDTTVGKKYEGSSATEASLVVA